MTMPFDNRICEQLAKPYHLGLQANHTDATATLNRMATYLGKRIAWWGVRNRLARRTCPVGCGTVACDCLLMA